MNGSNVRRQAIANAFERIVASEGGLSMDPQDRGNWTSGVVGQGELKGTKYGVSAMAYPFLNIATLTKDAAQYYFEKDYWDKVQADHFHPAIAFQLVDASYNHGRGNAIRMLQRAVDVADDGIIGPLTLDSVNGEDTDDVLHLFNAERLVFYTKISTFNRYGKGWVRRVAENMKWAADDNDAPWGGYE